MAKQRGGLRCCCTSLTFGTREALLLHIMTCPHVFPAVHTAARKEYESPLPVPATAGRSPAVYPDFFEIHATSTLPKNIKR